MRLSRIYSSKLYLTSPRKDKIKAAMENSLNSPLVQQLSDYLDDKDKEILYDIVEEKEAKENPAPELDIDSEVNESLPDEDNVFSPSYSGGGGSFGGGDFGGDFEGEAGEGGEGDEPNIFDIPEGEEPPADDLPDDAVEESTAIYGEVKACTNIENVAADIDVIKGTLNSREDTAGVQRINIDEKELWIYYKDEVNIGDIMVNVIEALNGTNYTYLSFSRLARSNNAIVFDISEVSEPIKSVNEVEETKK